MKAWRALARPNAAWIGVLWCGFFLSDMATGADNEGDETVPAVILKVEGDGTARVKKAFGVEEAAGAGGKILPGDKVITDARSAVFILLNDGSVLKVGLSSEFKLEEAEMHDRFLSWAFRLVKGTMRALVEKSPEPETRLRIHTPGGTVGVRGTEFVVAIDDDGKTSRLYTIEGLVTYGPPECEQAKSCVEVRAGETTSLQEGQKAPPKPKAFAPGELFGVARNAEGKPAADARTDQRMSLFQDAKRVTSRFKQDMEDEALRKLVEEASESLAAAQDRAIGRTRAQRIAMHKAMKDGSYQEVMEAADAYGEAKDIFKADANDGAENFVAQTAAAKFRLGMAVKEAKEAGVFGNMSIGKDGKLAVNWKEEKFQVSKSVNYDKEAAAKGRREGLDRAADEYKKTLEFAEAHPSPRKPEDKKGEADSGEGAGDVRKSTAAAAGAHSGGQKASVVAQDQAGSCRGKRCRVRVVAHEMGAMSEGVVEAFSGTSKADNGRPSSFSAVSVNKGEFRTGFFRKAIPGNACYREEKECKLVPCPQFSQGKKCKKGESLQSCTVKKIPVRCPERGGN